MPAGVRAAIDEIAGSRVIDAVNVDGGFSPGPAARCRLADGRVVFVKAAGTELNPVSPEMHRREGQVLAGLHVDVPASQLIGVFDDGDWVALVIEWINGVMPVAPLGRDDVDRLLGLVGRLSCVEGRHDLQSCADAHPGLFGHWQQLIDQQIDGLDAWSARHLERLAELEVGVADAIAGDRLVHLDFRSDNVIFAAAVRNTTWWSIGLERRSAQRGSTWSVCCRRSNWTADRHRRRCSSATPWGESPTQTRSAPSSPQSPATSRGCR